MENITPTSYWLIPDKIIISGYPDPREKYQNDKKFYKVCKNIVCLMEEQEFITLTDYRQAIPSTINYIHYPIPDRKTVSDDEIIELVEQIYRLEGITMIHCWGGHGRSGVIACLLFHKHYPEVETDQIFHTVNKLHSSREVLGRKIRSKWQTPQTRVQIQQVKRIIKLTQEGGKITVE